MRSQQTGGKEGGSIALIFGMNYNIQPLKNGDIPSGTNQYT